MKKTKKFKFKTKKSLLKRIKITGSGKILRSHQLRTGHLRRNKSKQALRRYKRPVLVHKTMAKKFKMVLGI